MLEGVRQCGKTYLLKQFGDEYFSSNVVYVNFEKDKSVHSLFENNLDPMKIIKDLSIYYNKDITPGRTLVILDEVQECGRAMTSLKYFSEEAKEYHVACAGSLIGLMLNNDSFPVGKVKRLRLYPMTFLEFLRAEGEEKLCEYLTEKDPTEPVSDAIHSMAMDHLKNYYLVGGMPKAVDSWIKYHSVPRVTKIQKSLLKDYHDDFGKHGGKMIDELTAIWNSIPNQLMKDNRRMILKDVLPRGRAEVFAAPLQWLMNAGLIHCVYQIGAPNIPLSEVKDESMFKVYSCDVGLLRTMSGIPPNFVLSNDDKYRVFKGAIAETLSICSMKASDYHDDICYWKKASNDVDIIVSTSKGIVPMEVKYGYDLKGASLNKYCDIYHPDVSVHLSSNNARSGRRLYVPLYSCETLIPFLNKNSDDHVEPVSDPSLPFVLDFSQEDWSNTTDGCSITVPRSRHNRNSPSVVQVFERTGSGGLVSVITSSEITTLGDVVIRVNQPFAGRVSII